MEHACGILKDLFQQNILALAEAYAGPVDPKRVFPDHLTRRQQSLRLREDLWELVMSCRRFQDIPDNKRLAEFSDDLTSFRRDAMRYLMFKDWSVFDRFAAGFSKDCSTKTLLAPPHPFQIFPQTLIPPTRHPPLLPPTPFFPNTPTP